MTREIIILSKLMSNTRSMYSKTWFATIVNKVHSAHVTYKERVMRDDLEVLQASTKMTLWSSHVFMACRSLNSNIETNESFQMMNKTQTKTLTKTKQTRGEISCESALRETLHWLTHWLWRREGVSRLCLLLLCCNFNGESFDGDFVRHLI